MAILKKINKLFRRKPNPPIADKEQKEIHLVTCPSCDGKGYHVYYPSTSSYDWHPSDVGEDWGASPERCKKCGGTGNVASTKLE